MKKNYIIKKAKFLVTFFLLIIFAFHTNAQNHKFRGKVIDQNKNPLPGASIFIKDQNKGTTTNFNGEFEIEIKKGFHTLEISFVGYTTLTQKGMFTGSQPMIFVLKTNETILDEVLVSALRVKADAPVTHSNMSKKEIEKRNLGQDIPILMNYLPSVVTTSDAGAGVGYTGIRVRGSDATRVNVTINGIPYNDSESMGTYWVNLGDFASSVENLQLQRGVGTSTNGAGAFGASLNMLTDAISENAFGQIASSAGSYGTLKNTLKFSTGRLNNHFELAGRISKIQSDGYIDRASSDLKSYFFQASYVDKNTFIKALVFGGEEETYQAWYGTPKVRIDGDQAGVEQYIIDNGLSDKDAENLRNSDRRYNFYTYDNEVDHYNQDHYQLLWNEQISENLSTNIALHYTKGKGYFEQYKEGSKFAEYGLTPIVIESTTIDQTDLIQRKWLDNDFYGFTFSANYANEFINTTLGGGLNKYEGDHFGEIIWAQYASQSNIRQKFYDNYGDKIDGNVYWKGTYNANEQLSLFLDLQGRYISYKATGVADGFIEKNYHFFNPKAGLTYHIDENSSLYGSYARANREPNRTDFENGSPSPESLDDYELGLRFKTANVKINSNLYLMNYQNQLVLTGGIDATTGAPLRMNVGNSYRIGLEIDAEIKLSDMLSTRPNIALSKNKNKDFYFNWNGTPTNYGDTNIAFSPEIVAGNIFTYAPTQNFQLSLLSKYIGSQFMGNIDAEASKLESYFVNDINVTYQLKTNSTFKSIVFSALINNVLNEKYSSNGFYGTWDDDYSSPTTITTYEFNGFYPQATRNFLLGVTLNF